MTNESLSLDVKRFIAGHINSVEQIEILLLLCEDARQVWTAPSVAGRLYIQPGSAEMRLDDLTNKAICTKHGNNPTAYRYAPQSPAAERMVSLLMEAYHVRRDSVISTIFEKDQS